MLTCFDDVLQWKGGCEAPTGLLLDDVVRVAEVEKFLTADYASVNELIESKRDFAIRNVVNECVAKFRSQLIPKTILENKRAGYWADNAVAVAAGAQMRGMELEICNTDTFYEIYLSEVETLLQVSGDVTMYVVDTLTGQTLHEFTVVSVAGVPTTTYVDLTIKAAKRKRRIGIVYDATSVGSYQTAMMQSGCLGCTGGRYVVGRYVSGRPITYTVGATPTAANVSGANSTGGISALYNLRCDMESWLCINRNVLALPILYRTAREILFYGLEMSDRANTKTNIDRASVERRMNKAHSDYEEQIGIALRNIVPPNDGVCFICNRRAMYATTLP
jgi:hypothetical protein